MATKSRGIKAYSYELTAKKPLTEKQKQLASDHVWVVGFVSRYYHRLNAMIPYDDLVGIGHASLVSAASRWEDRGQCKFSTYAIRSMRSGMIHYIAHHKYGHSGALNRDPETGKRRSASMDRITYTEYDTYFHGCKKHVAPSKIRARKESHMPFRSPEAQLINKIDAEAILRQCPPEWRRILADKACDLGGQDFSVSQSRTSQIKLQAIARLRKITRLDSEFPEARILARAASRQMTLDQYMADNGLSDGQMAAQLRARGVKSKATKVTRWRKGTRPDMRTARVVTIITGGQVVWSDDNAAF
jgi:hypothetical protein